MECKICWKSYAILIINCMICIKSSDATKMNNYAYPALFLSRKRIIIHPNFQIKAIFSKLKSHGRKYANFERFCNHLTINRLTFFTLIWQYLFTPKRGFLALRKASFRTPKGFVWQTRVEKHVFWTFFMAFQPQFFSFAFLFRKFFWQKILTLILHIYALPRVLKEAPSTVFLYSRICKYGSGVFLFCLTGLSAAIIAFIRMYTECSATKWAAQALFFVLQASVHGGIFFFEFRYLLAELV